MKRYNLTVGGTEYAVEVNSVSESTLEVNINDVKYVVDVEEVAKPKPTIQPSVIEEVATKSASGSGTAGSIKSPLPGTIVDIFVKPGDKVSVGQRVMLLEAMKMENNIEAEISGTVLEVKVAKTDTVMEGDVLIVLGE
jgi:biotin carboxyl carrier protein